ncbi:MAG: hypothetical protein Q8Q32_01775 [bacterium]|nr:hypothetical protein [bacterium]
MSRAKVIGWALVHGLATAGYVYLVVSLISFIEKLPFAEASPLAPVAFLLLLVTSAAITASLVFGRPLLWYLDKRKDEAIALAVYTVAWLIVILMKVFYFVLINL